LRNESYPEFDIRSMTTICDDNLKRLFVVLALSKKSLVRCTLFVVEDGCSGSELIVEGDQNQNECKTAISLSKTHEGVYGLPIDKNKSTI
jgi:hypothetical protein